MNMTAERLAALAAEADRVYLEAEAEDGGRCQGDGFPDTCGVTEPVPVTPGAAGRPPVRAYGPRRVDPFLLARALGFRVEFHRLSREGSVCGLIAPFGAPVPVFDRGQCEYITADGDVIFLERALRLDGALVGVMHFTLAHELAHGLMARELPAGGGEYDVGLFGDEKSADKLAAALLLPERLIGEALVYFGLPPHIRSLRDDFARQYGLEHRFNKMAAHLQVSRQALAIRLNALGVLRLMPPVGHRIRTARPDEIIPGEEWN